MELDSWTDIVLINKNDEEVAKLTDFLNLIEYLESENEKVAEKIIKGSKVDTHMLIYYII